MQRVFVSALKRSILVKCEGVMLNYFLENRDNEAVDTVCAQLSNLKKRIYKCDYSDSRKEFNECQRLFNTIKEDAIKHQNEKLANAQLVFREYFLLFCGISDYFQLLKEKKYRLSWDVLQDCLDYLRFVGKYVEVGARKEIPSLYELMVSYEQLYPYKCFASSEYIISKSHCSICGKSMQSVSCPHIKGELYWGEIAVEIIDEIQEFQAVCLVSHPEDKRCIIEPPDEQPDSKKYGKLEQFIELDLPFLQQFTITSLIETRKRTDIVKVGRNNLCSCGSGKKYKKCCGMNLFYQHERNIVTPGNMVRFEY